MTLSTEDIERMDEAEERLFWAAFGDDLARDDGDAARDHLAAGFPIYFRDDDTPKGLIIKQHPDGRRELVSFGEGGERVVQAPA